MQLQLFDQIPPGSLLLFEIFGIKNPSITHALILFQIYSIKKGNEPELIMTSSRNYIHYFLNYEVNYNNSIETELYNINPFHVNGLHHPPSIFEITLNELILPNFLLYITPSKNIKDFIYNNSNLKVYADVTNENTKISSIQDLELIQRQEDYIENDNQSSSKQDLKENLFTKPKIYKIPIVRTFSSNHESINLTIGRPSLSQRTLKITFYNYLLPDDDDEFCLTLDIMVKFNILIKKTACTKFLKGVSANLLFKILKTDIRVESIRSNMSIELNPNFTIDGIINYIGIFFDESITIPDEINTFVNGHMVFHDIFDNIIIGYLPDLDRNKPFIFEISDFLGSLSYLNMKGSIIIMSFYKDMPAIIAQSVFSLEKTQNLATSKIKLVITDISPKTFSTFDKIPSFTMIVWVDNYQPKINHTFRVILPNDFPSDFLIPSENLQCLLEIINITIIETICQMKGTFLDLTIIENVQIIENNLEFSFKITIENLVSSPNSGNSGDFMILIYDETKKMIGTTFRSSDFYINPVIHQTLEFITKSHDLNLNVDVKLIRIKKGAIKQIYLFPKDKKVHKIFI